MKQLLFLLCATSVFAGQSLIIPNGTRAAFIEANIPNPVPYRIEFQVHDWSVIAGTDPTLMDLSGAGLSVQWVTPAATSLVISNNRDTLSGSTPVLNTPGTNVKVRIQRNPTGSAINGFPAMTFLCEIWANDGSGYSFVSDTILTTPAWGFSGGAFGDSGPNVLENLGFYREMNTLVPPHSLSPVTANPACPGATCLIEYKFDGNLNDSSGTCSSSCITISSPGYVNPTPAQFAFPYISTAYLPAALSSITQVIPLRAGNPGQLDGTSSFSMADASSSVNYFWQVLAGPSGEPPLSWDSHTASQPTIGNTIFGDYIVQLQVTDMAGNTGTTTVDVGSVATDVNHIVVDAKQAFSDAVFGQQIAYGYNNFPYQDWSNLNASNGVGGQIGAPNSGTPISADWDVQQPGTVYISGTTATFSGINTQNVFCGGGSTWPGGATQVWLIIWYDDTVITSPQRVGRYPLQPLVGAGCPTTSTLTLDLSSHPWPVSRAATCTMGSPCQFSASTNWLLAINQGQGSYGYYDGATMFYALWRRTGLNQPATWGQQLTAIEVRAPGIDQGVIPLVQPRINPTRQWAVNQVYFPSSTNFSIYQLGLRNFAASEGLTFVPPGNSFSAYSINLNGSKLDVTPYSIDDVRENGAQIIDIAAECYVETDMTLKALYCDDGMGAGYLEASWINMFGPQLQSDGHWDQAMRGNAPTVVGSFTNGSTAVTPTLGTWANTQCGTLTTAAGTVTVNGTTAVVGSGTSFTGANAQDYIVIYGLFSGVYGKQIDTIASITDNTHLTLFSAPNNLDHTSGLSYKIFSQAGFQPSIVIDTTDSSGNLISNLPDPNWYTCTWNNSSSLTLDHAYQATSRDGFIVNSNGDLYTLNQGNQPFMESFPAAGYELGSLVGTAHASQMAAAARGLYPFVSTTGWSAASKGAYYATTFGNCVPQFQFSAGCGSVPQNARMFGVEPLRALAAGYLAAPSSPMKTFLQAYYCAEWGNSAFDSQGCDDGTHVDDCGDSFITSVWKFAYQCFAMGSTASMPAALLGGLAPLTPRTVQVQGHLNGADHVIATVLAPSGAITNTTCTSFPCTVSVDDRVGYGSHNLTLAYYNSGNTLIAQGAPTVIK